MRKPIYMKKPGKFEFGASALIVIDMQQYFLDEKSHAFVPKGKAMVPIVRKVIDMFHSNGQPVIFTSFAVAKGEQDPIMRWWGDSVAEGSRYAEITDEFDILDGDFVMRKPTYSSFYGTGLEKCLHQKKVRQLVITGVLTNLCCETTARDAFNRNFDVFIVTDGVAAYDDKMHAASLKNLAYGFATLMRAEALETFGLKN